MGQRGPAHTRAGPRCRGGTRHRHHSVIDLASDENTFYPGRMVITTPTARELTLDQILERQQQAFLADPQPSAKVRRDRITRLKRLVLDNAAELTEAMREDYGSRPETLSTLTDIASSIPDLNHQRSHLKKWMKPTRISRVLDRVGFHQQVRHDPKGVVGIMGPWNFPLYLTIVRPAPRSAPATA